MVMVGVDEVGRGCWAGPLVACAVILPRTVDGLTDSKRLSRKQRATLDMLLRRSNTVFGLGWVHAQELDRVGLSHAVEHAMRRAVECIKVDYDALIIDGNINYLADNPLSSPLVKADLTVPAVSAASVIAKVARDRFMVEQGVLFPEYGFESHVGYGTRQHKEALKQHGLTPLHRRSFAPIKDLI